MRKIPTLFERIYENHKVVGITDKLSDERLQVVLDGKCTPTVKIDGACCAVINGEWYKRYDAKKGKKAPEGAIPCQDKPDEITGHWPHWVKLDETKAEDKWFIEAFRNYFEKDGIVKTIIDNNEVTIDHKNCKGLAIDEPFTYEAMGPHFQNNPEGYDRDIVIPHGCDIIKELQGIPLTFKLIKDFLKNMEIEGIVFWLTDPTGEYPICKIKRSDFGFEWPVKKGE